MTAAAPRIDSRLLAALMRLDRPERSIADIHRGVGTIAETLGLTRPSYEQVRVLVHDLRAERRHPGVGDHLLDIALSTRPKLAILRALDG